MHDVIYLFHQFWTNTNYLMKRVVFQSYIKENNPAQQLMMAMNASLPDPIGNFYVINPVEISRTGGELNVRRPNDPLDNSFDYYLFYASEEVGPVNLCLERNTMNAYFNFLRYLGHQKIKEDEGLGTEYSLINLVKMKGAFEFVNEELNNDRIFFHKGSFNYGIKVHYITEPIYPIELD